MTQQTVSTRLHVGPYQIANKIGKGTFGKVKLGVNIFTNEKVAIKIIKYKHVHTSSEKRLIEREKAALKLLNHPYIVKLQKVVDDAQRGCSFLVLEYVPGGELFEYIISKGRIKEKEARKFIRQIISALEYCHSHLIVHRDLKPENLLLDENMNIKITDFGLSNIISPGKKFTTFCGSLHYACPEILRGEEYVGPGADIWSLGVILYCLVTGSQPWSASSSDDILELILTKGLVIPSWISDDCADLIIRMLRLKEKDRITIEEMKSHPWVMKDYTSIPESHLPSYNGVLELDEEILTQLSSIGFDITEKQRSAILKGKKTQIVSTYHLLLRMKNEESEKKVQKKEKKVKKNKNKIDESRVRSGTVVDENSGTDNRERSGSEPPKFYEKNKYKSSLDDTVEEETTSTVNIKKITKVRNSSKVPPLSIGKVKHDDKTSGRPLSADSKKDVDKLKEKKTKELSKSNNETGSTKKESKQIGSKENKRKSGIKSLKLKEEKMEC